MNRVIALILVAACSFPSPALATPHVGQPVPPLSLPTADGRTLNLASLRGKPIYVNFFATWCPPCNDEAASIGALGTTYRKRGLVIVGVDELENARKAREFLTQHHLAYTALVDVDGAAGKDFGALGLPVHVFIDRTGIVRTFRQGEMDPGEIEAAIKGIL